VRVQDFLAWLARKGGSPAEVALRSKLSKMLRELPSRAAMLDQSGISPLMLQLASNRTYSLR
jgi:hypothetical protein